MVAELAPIVVIVGPTASGKTGFGIKIAKKYNGEVICADSRTVYKGMNIGTAKPTKAEMDGVTHHLLNIVQPNQSFTAANFKKLADLVVEEVWKRGKIPILVGGSGLYVNSVIYNFKFGSKANELVRKKLESLSVNQLQKRCKEEHIPVPENSKNKRYLIRAIELGGLVKQPLKLRPNTLIVGILTTKDKLKERITARAELMFDGGVVDETIELVKKYGQVEVLKNNIYGAVCGYINNDQSLQEAKTEFIKSDLRLAKKQITWFKRDQNVTWGSIKQLQPIVGRFIRSYSQPTYQAEQMSDTIAKQKSKGL